MMSEQDGIDLTQEESGKVPTIDKGTHLHRVLGVPQLFAIGYGDVGSSIYYALGVTTLYALGAAPIALMIAGLTFICTVMTYAELSSALPEAGGSSSYARHAYNDLVSFIAGWALLLDYIVTIAISAYTIGPYLGYFFPVLKTTAGNLPFTVAVILTLMSLNIFGIKESTRVSLLLVIFNTATQLTVIIIALVTLLNLPTLFAHMKIGIPNVEWSPTWPQFFKGIGMAMVAYIGIESIAQLAGESRDPGKAVPKAMFLSMATLLVMYFGISSVALSAYADRPMDFVNNYLEDPLAGVVAVMPIGGDILGPSIGILGAVILFVAANAGLIGASRLTFSMGEYFQLPKMFFNLHPKYRTPHVSLIFFSVLATAVVLAARELKFIADLYNFGAMLAFSLAHLSLIGLRIRKPELARPFKIPFNFKFSGAQIPISAVIGLLATFAVWIDVIVTKPSGRNLGFVWMGLGISYFLYYRYKQHLPASKSIEIEKLQIPEYHDVALKKILIPTRGGNHTDTVQFAAKLAKTYNAELIAIYVIEIPSALPLDTFFPEKLMEADLALERAQAIAREYDVSITTHVVQSRSWGDSIVEAASKEACDLIVIGVPSGRHSPRSHLGSSVEHILNRAHCRVWLCRGELA